MMKSADELWSEILSFRTRLTIAHKGLVVMEMAGLSREHAAIMMLRVALGTIEYLEKQLFDAVRIVGPTRLYGYQPAPPHSPIRPPKGGSGQTGLGHPNEKGE